MKKILYSFALVLVAFVSQANHYNNSELNLDVYGNTRFTVALDAEVFNRPDYHYRILDVTPGSHYLEVRQASFHPYGYGIVIFSGYVNIPVASEIFARIDRYGRFKINRVAPLHAEPAVYNQPHCTHEVPAMVPMAMNNYDFDMLRNSIDSKSFESTRMEIAKQVLSQRYVTSGQVMELMKLMTFESTKLELAKFAFGRTVDKQNFYRVNDEFTFESSIRELNDYILNMG